MSDRAGARALTALLLFALVLPLATLVAEAGECGDDCPAACGDCAFCPVPAVAGAAPTPAAPAAGLEPGALVVVPAVEGRSRALEHVPLRRG